MPYTAARKDLSLPFTESETLQHLQMMEVLSGHPRVAIRLVELARNPLSEVEDYAALVETDAGLTGRILGLVNSAWYAPSTPIETVRRAVYSLGTSNVRTVCLAHSIASLHKTFGLSAVDSQAMWSASMCKAIAARKVIERSRPEQATEAFTMALLQDIGLAFFRSLDPEAVSEIHTGGCHRQVEALALERRHFGLDHCQAAEHLGHKLTLPEFYIQTIDIHHEDLETEKLGTLSPIGLASHLASLLPHDTRYWSPEDVAELTRALLAVPLGWDSLEAFAAEVQSEFQEIHEQLGEFEVDISDLMTALAYASEETARSTSVLVAKNYLLATNTNTLQEAVIKAEKAQEKAEQRADMDPLTRLFNRRGWDRRAKTLLRQASSSHRTVGIAFLDLDYFKEINDEHGHATGDAFLVEIGRRIKEAVRSHDLVCRWGGDEFVILFQGIDSQDCVEAVLRVKQHVEARPVVANDVEMRVSTTAGFVSVEPSEAGFDLHTLLQQADELLYQAKQEGRGSFRMTG